MIVDVSNDRFTILGRFLVELNIEPDALWVWPEKMGIERLGVIGRLWPKLDI